MEAPAGPWADLNCSESSRGAAYGPNGSPVRRNATSCQGLIHFGLLTRRPRLPRKDWKQRTSVVLRQHTVTLVASARRCRNQPPPPELLCCGRPKVPFLPQYTWPRFGGAFLSGTNPRARNCPAAEASVWLPRMSLVILGPAHQRRGFFRSQHGALC